MYYAHMLHVHNVYTFVTGSCDLHTEKTLASLLHCVCAVYIMFMECVTWYDFCSRFQIGITSYILHVLAEKGRHEFGLWHCGLCSIHNMSFPICMLLANGVSVCVYFFAVVGFFFLGGGLFLSFFTMVCVAFFPNGSSTYTHCFSLWLVI